MMERLKKYIRDIRKGMGEIGEAQKLAEEISERFKELTKFEGSLEEFERYTGERWEILGPRLELVIPSGPYGRIPTSYQIEMYKNGVEAVVNYRSGLSRLSKTESGLPVRRERRDI